MSINLLDKSKVRRQKQVTKKGEDKMDKTRIRTYAMRFVAGVLVLLAVMSIPMLTHAVGDANIGGDNNPIGGSGSGSSNNKWPTEGGQTVDGIRVSVYKGNSKVGKTVDFSNFTSVDGVAIKNVFHFGKYSKKDYLGGRSAVRQTGNYAVVNPASSRKLPKIVKGNISTIRSYFTDKTTVQLVASETGVSYNTMVNDSSYQLMIEPIIYVIYNGYPYAMTAMN